MVMASCMTSHTLLERKPLAAVRDVPDLTRGGTFRRECVSQSVIVCNRRSDVGVFAGCKASDRGLTTCALAFFVGLPASSGLAKRVMAAKPQQPSV